MNRRLFFLLYVIFSMLATPTVCFDKTNFIKIALAILEKCMANEHSHAHVPDIFNKRLSVLLAHTTLDNLIDLMLEAEKANNPYILNGVAAAIADKLGPSPKGQQLALLHEQLSSLSYALIIKHSKFHMGSHAHRSCGGTPLSIADYVSLYDVPIEYFGNIGILWFYDQNINSLDGIQDISGSDIGFIVLSNNCIVGTDLDPQFPADPFQGMSNAYYLFADNNLIESLPSTFFNSVPGMREVYLGNNLLTELPDGLFSSLDQLAILELSYNTLTTVTANNIQNLSLLNQLYLDNNSLTEIPSDLFSSSTDLLYIFLNNNALTSWPSTAFNNLINSAYLDLSNNALTNFEPEFLPDGSEVILTGNLLTSSQEDVLVANFPAVNFIF